MRLSLLALLVAVPAVAADPVQPALKPDAAVLAKLAELRRSPQISDDVWVPGEETPPPKAAAKPAAPAKPAPLPPAVGVTSAAAVA